MSIRMRRPETTKLEISQGDWLLVKTHLTAGERREYFARMLGPDRETLDRVKVGWSTVIAYLLDWSFTDTDNQPIVIRDQPPEVVGAALDAIDADAFAEVLEAVETHQKAMAKNAPSETASPAISPSPDGAIGATNG